MFVRSVHIGTIKLVSVALLAVMIIVALAFLLPSYESPTASNGGTLAVNAVGVGDGGGTEIRFDKVKSAEDRVGFLSQFGYTVESAPLEECEVTIPKEFDKVFASYNELQKSEGLDLGRYKGKKVMRYTFKVTNYTDYSGTVYANLLIYKNKVIGGDICSADPKGFAHGLTKV